MSVRAFDVTPTRSRSPTAIALALVPSWVRVIVRVSVERAVTRTISELVRVSTVPGGPTVALNETAGIDAPSPAATINEVPDVAGLGAVATVVSIRFA